MKTRIVIHLLAYILTGDIEHWYETQHYYYMKKN
jgi:hypothetical protein